MNRRLKSAPRFLDVNQAAEYLMVSAGTLNVWRSTGRGPRFTRTSPTRTGKIIYPIRELNAYLEENAAGEINLGVE